MNLHQLLEKEHLAPSDDLIDKMLQQLGCTDPYIRDTLIYSTFAKWFTNDKLTNEQKKTVHNTAMNCCLIDIGAQENDLIFTRSFAVLLTTMTVSTISLTNQDYVAAFDHGITYLKKENDLRGYVHEKGWAHGIAHGADFLTSLVKHRYFEHTQATQVLESIYAPLLKNHVFTNDEYERLAVPLLTLIQYDDDTMNKEIVSALFNHTNYCLSLQQSEGFSQLFFHTRTNLIHFLMDVYFQLPDHYSTLKKELTNQILILKQLESIS